MAWPERRVRRNHWGKRNMALSWRVISWLRRCDFVAVEAHAGGEFGFFAGDEGGVVAVEVLEDVGAEEDISAEFGGFSRGGVPFHVGEGVVGAGGGIFSRRRPQTAATRG